MIPLILSVLTSSGFGAITGLVGSFLTKNEERKSDKQKLDHDLEMAKIRKEEAQLEFNHELAMADKQIERAQTEGQIQTDIAEVSAFAKSLDEQKKTYGIKWVDAIRGIMRPLITFYLLGIATFVVVEIWGLSGGLNQIPGEEISSMFKDVISNIMFLVTTAVTWWFGSRPSQPKRK